MPTLANSKDTNEMPENLALQQSLHCSILKDIKTPFLEILTYNPFKYVMDNLFLIVSICTFVCFVALRPNQQLWSWHEGQFT